MRLSLRPLAIKKRLHVGCSECVRSGVAAAAVVICYSIFFSDNWNFLNRYTTQFCHRVSARALEILHVNIFSLSLD